MVEVTIQTPLHTTEDPEKVVQAVRQIFPEAEVHIENGHIIATSTSLDTLIRKAREERVLDAARGALWRGRQDDNTTRFEVNKQAAYVGRINFNEVTHPLGDLQVTVKTSNLDALLDKIAPPTRAEVHADRTAEFRARVSQEEDMLTRMGSAVETGFEDEPEPQDVDPWEDDEDDEGQEAKDQGDEGKKGDKADKTTNKDDPGDQS